MGKAYTIKTGKYAGKTFAQIYALDPSFVEWAARSGGSTTMRQAADAVLSAKESQQQEHSLRLKTEFLHLARSQTFPGLSGRVRDLTVKAQSGFAEIALSSCLDALDMEEDDFFLLLSTQHPLLAIYSDRDLDGDETALAHGWKTNYRNPNLKEGGVPALNEPVWYAIDGNNALNEEPVTAFEALTLLSEHIQQKSRS